MEGHGIRSNAPQAASAGKAGFTLVEVCLAVGIIAFAVLPLLGLLSIGLNSYRNAVVRARATQVLNQIANALRRAVPVTSNGTPTGQFLALAPFPQPPGTGAVTWTPAATPTAQLYTA
jgi:type II secretory pathway pseudopilin PulG